MTNEATDMQNDKLATVHAYLDELNAPHSWDVGDGQLHPMSLTERIASLISNPHAAVAGDGELEALRSFFRAVDDMTCVWAGTDRPSSISPSEREEAEDGEEEDMWDAFVAARSRVKALSQPAADTLGTGDAVLLSKLRDEYRPTMDTDILHSWAQDVVAALQSPSAVEG